MLDPHLVFTSPCKSTPLYDDDTPIRLLSTDDELVPLQAKKLFQDNSTDIGHRLARESGGVKTSMGCSIKTAIGFRKNLETPLESISNFSPHTVCGSEDKKPEQPCGQRAISTTEFKDIKNMLGLTIKEPAQTHKPTKPKQSKTQKQPILQPIRIRCLIAQAQPTNTECVKKMQYLVPECESSFYDQEIPFHESRLTQNYAENPTVSEFVLEPEKGFKYAWEQMQVLKENINKLREKSKKSKQVYFDSSVILSSGNRLEESFLDEIRSGLMQILQFAEFEQQNNPEYAQSERIDIHELSQISHDLPKSENPAKVSPHLQREHSMVFPDSYADNSDSIDLSANPNQYVTPVHRRSTYSETKSPANVQALSHSVSNEQSKEYSVISLALNADLNSSGQLIAKKKIKRRAERESKGKKQCRQSESESYEGSLYVRDQIKY